MAPHCTCPRGVYCDGRCRLPLHGRLGRGNREASAAFTRMQCVFDTLSTYHNSWESLGPTNCVPERCLVLAGGAWLTPLHLQRGRTRWHVDDCLPARAVCMLAGHSCAIRHMAQVPTGTLGMCRWVFVCTCPSNNTLACQHPRNREGSRRLRPCTHSTTLGSSHPSLAS